MVKRNIRQIIGVVMAAVFLATIAGSAGALLLLGVFLRRRSGRHNWKTT